MKTSKDENLTESQLEKKSETTISKAEIDNQIVNLADQSVTQTPVRLTEDETGHTTVVLGPYKFELDAKIKFVANPKRVWSKTYQRYEKYQHAQTIGELLKMNKDHFRGDLKYDLDKGFCRLLDNEGGRK